ncbi:MAG: ribbon-helix-helix domain-containing protein [Candidatus Aminicenantes bacterium]|nr:ribbon-helix-helix domain-containing protein [Candidatus Aminicenantes bacterium]
MSQSMTIRIPDDLRKQLQKISKAEGKPVSDIVRESLKRYLTLYEFERLRAMTIPYAEAQGIYTDEDVFKLIS